MGLTNILDHEGFSKFISTPKISVIHFYADWAAQCTQMNEVMEELSNQQEFKQVNFGKCLAEDIPEASLSFNVSAVPTFIFVQNGKLLDRVDGANAGEVTKKINSLISKSKDIPAKQKVTVPAQDLNSRLKTLINAAPVMVFMKGSAQEPRCGFSKQLVGILDSLQAEYKTFDILNDEQVRQGLKEYSKWPTYPQLYVNGELIGGLDILKEMQEAGELESILPKKKSLEDRLKFLVNKSPVMIFMKGDRNMPRCGFSRTLMEIMKETGVPFETFDILEDEEVRQGLKKFSNWPTYPQVYVKGEIIGGLDIIKELKEQGELLQTLAPA